MTTDQLNLSGRVYILQVKDIDLPVCKIGMTSRTAYERCVEINNSSTGDFLWEVAYELAVSDHRGFESLIHEKLAPLRQKRREFFNISAEDALTAVRSILKSQAAIVEMPIPENALPLRDPAVRPASRKPSRVRTFKEQDSRYAEMLQKFAEVLDVKGRPFGQLNKPFFGLSDGVDGVQWNINIFPELGEARIGVNLEGKMYGDWPIAKFILSELDEPTMEIVRAKLERPDLIMVSFMRDAWQVLARPEIEEKYIGGAVVPLSQVHAPVWRTMLLEARDCLAKDKGYRGRAKQDVTLRDNPKTGQRIRAMDVSPHLTLYLPISIADSTLARIEDAVKSLRPVHQWLSEISSRPRW